ncbi:MAG TPA: proteasome subunit alpha [Actinomycetota bacterium]|nr:proteasome subunit alpha [Actinomycetota bacterium]
MSPMPYYVSPEQLMKDRADYARKGIARGKSIIAVECDEGILIVAENPSATLHKVSEIYDRIAFAAVGKYNEFENFRIAGVRLADLRGYAYDREDVSGRAIANAYAQTLGAIFTEQMKPYEVELLVAQVGSSQETDEMYRVMYDGSVSDEQGFMAMGGHAEALANDLQQGYRQQIGIGDAFTLAAKALAAADSGRTLTPANLEVAALERHRPRRTFRRYSDEEVGELLAQGS